MAMKIDKIFGKKICFKFMCSTHQDCISSVGIFSLSTVSISLAYTIFFAYQTFLSKQKKNINENFSFRDWNETIKCDSEYFSVILWMRSARIKIIFFLEIVWWRYPTWRSENDFCFFLFFFLCTDIKNNRNYKGQTHIFILLKLYQNIVAKF